MLTLDSFSAWLHQQQRIRNAKSLIQEIESSSQRFQQKIEAIERLRDNFRQVSLHEAFYECNRAIKRLKGLK